MPKIDYTLNGWNPTPDIALMVDRAEAICVEYAADGYDLTLRQLYYQFVARGWLANTERNYKNLGNTVNKARMAGLIDWNHIEDRTRALAGMSHWDSPGDVVDAAARSYHVDHWADQDTRIEVWVEKEALAGVVQRVANRWDVDYFSCRGYVSQSEQWRAGRRIGRYLDNGQDVVILYLGDHDPSGIDMTRDVRERLRNFLDVDHPYRSQDLEVRRIALNIDQVRAYNPPPNPTKLTDSRSGGYVAAHGYESWELDALDPRTLDTLIEDHIRGLVDQDRYDAVEAQTEAERIGLQALARRPWHEISEWLEGSA